jgi:hypothetical protein
MDLRAENGSWLRFTACASTGLETASLQTEGREGTHFVDPARVIGLLDLSDPQRTGHGPLKEGAEGAIQSWKGCLFSVWPHLNVHPRIPRTSGSTGSRQHVGTHLTLGWRNRDGDCGAARCALMDEGQAWRP